MISASTMVLSFGLLLPAFEVDPGSESIRPAGNLFHDLVGAEGCAARVSTADHPEQYGRRVGRTPVWAFQVPAVVDLAGVEIVGSQIFFRRPFRTTSASPAGGLPDRLDLL
jgi:hypothetical protein